jgi:hypothetical protein
MRTVCATRLKNIAETDFGSAQIQKHTLSAFRLLQKPARSKGAETPIFTPLLRAGFRFFSHFLAKAYIDLNFYLNRRLSVFSRALNEPAGGKRALRLFIFFLTSKSLSVYCLDTDFH